MLKGAYLVSWSLLCRGCEHVPWQGVTSEGPHKALLWITSFTQPSLFQLEEIIFRGLCVYWIKLRTSRWPIRQRNVDVVQKIPTQYHTLSNWVQIDVAGEYCHYLERMCHPRNSDIQRLFQISTTCSTGWFTAGFIHLPVLSLERIQSLNCELPMSSRANNFWICLSNSVIA